MNQAVRRGEDPGVAALLTPTLLVGIAALTAMHCGDPDPSVSPRDYRAIVGVPAAGAWTSTQSMTVTDTVQRLGQTNERDVVAVFDGRVHQTRGDDLEMRIRYVSDGEPLSYGVVRDIESRHTGGAYVAADEGLFLLGPLFVTRSPLSDEVGAVHALSEAASGALSGLWLATELGLFIRTPAGLESLSVDGVEVAPSHVAIEREGRFGAVVYEDELFVLHPVDGGFIARPTQLPTGGIYDVAASHQKLWVATDAGLFTYDHDSSPAWTQYTLADGEPAPVLAIAVDGESGVAWARTRDALVRFVGDTRTAYDQPDWTAERPTLGVDRLGQVWSGGNGANLNTARAAPTTPIGTEARTFSRDIAPWIEMHCAQCHSNQTADFRDYDVFRARAQESITRVQGGDMPRCNGGLRCPDEDRLDPAQYEILEQWIRDGLRP